MFSRKCQLLKNPVISLTGDVLGVIPLIIAFYCALALLINFYLLLPEGISDTFIAHVQTIIAP